MCSRATLISALIIVVSVCSAFATEHSLSKRDIQWSDEFSGTTLDLTKWDYVLYKSNGDELQQYTNSPENIYIKNGYLVIVTKRVNDTAFTSARITSKQTFTYGSFVMRAKLPKVFIGFILYTN